MRHATLCIVLIFAAGCARNPASSVKTAASTPQLMSPMDLQALPVRPPDHRIAYGEDSSHHGELRLPSTGSPPYPVVALVHGGCFKSQYATTRDLAPMADALKDAGIATWNIEYRRVGHPGGGWPNTYLDVGRAIDHLRTLAPQHNLDLQRVVVLGHSAGAHLAMWAVARSRVPAGSALSMPNPLAVRGVINLAGPLDLTANIDGYQSLCRDSVITKLMGGTPASAPERYAHASPMKLVSSGIPQVLIWGEHEDFVPRPLAEAYVEAAKQAGDSVRLILIPGVGHFETASPKASTWPKVESVIRLLLEGRMPPS